MVGAAAAPQRRQLADPAGMWHGLTAQHSPVGARAVQLGFPHPAAIIRFLSPNTLNTYLWEGRKTAHCIFFSSVSKQFAACCNLSACSPFFGTHVILL